jgi:hypothetical protein
MRYTEWICVIALFWLVPVSAQGAAQLVMTDSRSCRYCAQFHRQVGKDYHLTPAAEVAPLRRVNLSKKWPADLSAVRPAYHTPVFILVENGQERGRFFGYVGKELFWQKLNPLLAQLEAPSADPIPDLQMEGRAGLF